MESIRDMEDDAGLVFKRSRLAGAATYGTKYSIRHCLKGYVLHSG